MDIMLFPVNPTTTEVLGRKSYASISEMPKQLDIVDIFRRPKDVSPVIDGAIQ